MSKSILPNYKRGFTLIEVLLAIAVISIFVGVAIPEIIKFNRRQTLSSITNDMVAALRQAQAYAANGIQGEATFIKTYSLVLDRDAGDPADRYRGYDIVRLDKDGLEITPSLDSSRNSCPVCVISTMSSLDFKIPTGSVGNLIGSSVDLQVCYPEIGSYTITVDNASRIFSSEFSEASCTCDLTGC